MLTHQRVSDVSHDQNINMCNKVFSFIPTNIIICSLFSIYIMFVFVFIVFVNVFCPNPPKRSPPPWLKLVTGKTNFLQSLVAAHQYLHPREILQFHKGEKLSNKSNKHCLLNRVSQIKSLTEVFNQNWLFWGQIVPSRWIAFEQHFFRQGLP